MIVLNVIMSAAKSQHKHHTALELWIRQSLGRMEIGEYVYVFVFSAGNVLTEILNVRYTGEYVNGVFPVCTRLSDFV